MADIGELNDFLEKKTFLINIFGATVSSSVVETVLESCNGDVNLAADTIMNFTNEMPADPPEEATNDNSKGNVEIPVQQQPNIDSVDISRQQQQPNKDNVEIFVTSAEPVVDQQPTITSSPESQEIQALPVSFSEAFRNTGAIPKKPLDSKILKPYYTNNIRPDQVRSIITHHNDGNRILILMRGASGSGKTFLAKHIIDCTIGASNRNYERHIFSTDSYFMRDGFYLFDKSLLDVAHSTNQRNVCEATKKGLSPIIVDNTNMELWEMEPYTRDGVRNGYIIEIVEPNTPWAKNANQLSKKNQHGVNRETIRRMLDRYEKRITPVTLLKLLKLTYPANKKPPVKRRFPPVSFPESTSTSAEETTLHKIEYNSGSVPSTSNVEIFHIKSPDSPDKHLHEDDNKHTAIIESVPGNDDEHALKLQKIIEAQEKFDQFEKVEKEWDNGESWDVKTENANAALQDQAIALDPKPPREAEKNKTAKLIEPVSICDDWTKISMFMSPWQDETSSNMPVIFEVPAKVETKSVSTCFEAGDINQNIHKVLYGTPRYINEGIPEKKSKIPKVVLFDKSTSTHESDLLIEKKVCKNKEHHFRQLRGIFRSVPRHILRDIFESCNCDSNWTFDLMHGFYPDRQVDGDNKEDNISDSDEEPIDEPTEDCNCLAAYNIIPDMVPETPVLPVPELTSQKSPTTSLQKKTKKEIKSLSDSSLQLKRQIESNVMISDNHYSQHYLDMRRRREIHNDTTEKASGSAQFNTKIEEVANTTPGDNIVEMDNAVALPEASTPNNPNDIRDIVRPSTSQYNFDFMDSDTESDSSKSDHFEKTVPVSIGTEFLEKLDELFGRQGFQYPENIKPVVNLPMSILQQINAHWTMSVASQMDDGSKQTEAMIKQDEDFARQLADKKEMSMEGEDADVPSLKEIMDMELAYSIYERDIAEWRNNEPQDLAAKLSRDKLYKLFPDLLKDVLSEMLMAHDYNFKSTVESLLISTGQTSWLEDKKGIEKFVMHKETQRKEKFLEEQKKSLDDAEWPYLGNAKKPITLETVNYYRDKAQQHLSFRQKSFEKANSYLNVNACAATFYSEIASGHMRQYEHFSCLAAAYLMHYHLTKNPDQNVLDLHFLRVPEAMVNLDIFLDQTILKLRDKNINYKETWIITGKGAHSPGGPRIKPATKRRLKAREIRCKEVNAGLLAAQLRPTNKMTNELKQLENT